ncbi:MAG: glycerol-3-phosphate acyltransferase [Chloroflexi bacterium]|nr:glycerol-3-phosphate acyltransferase [Chloroflexota bacterium]
MRKRCLLFVGSAWLLGTLPIAGFLGRSQGVDLARAGTRTVGSHNLAALTNWKLGLLAWLGDATKGIVAVYLAGRYGAEPTERVCIPAAVVAGQCWPLWHGFGGGRGVATTVGAMLAVDPLSALRALSLTACCAGLRPLLARLRLSSRQLELIRDGAVPVGVLLGVLSWPLWLYAERREKERAVSAIGVLAVVCVRRLTARGWPPAWSQAACRLLLDRDHVSIHLEQI